MLACESQDVGVVRPPMAGRTIVITKDVGIFDETGVNTCGHATKPGKQSLHHTGRNLLVLAAAFTLSFTFTYTNAQGP